MHVSGDKTLEVCVLEEKHREEMAALKKKLQLFAENQELLDRDADRLKAATSEIHQLKEQVRPHCHIVFIQCFIYPHLARYMFINTVLIFPSWLGNR